MKNIILISVVSFLIFSCKKDENYTITHDNILGKWEFISGTGEYTDIDSDTSGAYNINECPLTANYPYIDFFEDTSNPEIFRFKHYLPTDIYDQCDYNSFGSYYHTFEIVDDKVLLTDPFGNIEWNYKFKLQSNNRIKFEYELNPSENKRIKNTYILDRL